MSIYTNSSLSCARSCLRKYELRYERRLSLALPEESEALSVGRTWHDALSVAAPGDEESVARAYEAIQRSAPSDEWREKLRQLFALHRWYYESDDSVRVVEAERQFEVEFRGETYRGSVDAVVELADGRRGILEYKTTSDSIDCESSYWDRLRLDAQVGIYALAMSERPEFVLYDVVRKPTIRPRKLTKAEVASLEVDLAKHGRANYQGLVFSAEVVEEALTDGRESLPLYGARLRQDVVSRPDFYFARRPVYRAEDDFDALLDDLQEQVNVLRYCRESLSWPRNPSACHAMGTCEFWSLCSNNRRVDPGEVPDRYQIREHLHPELDDPG